MYARRESWKKMQQQCGGRLGFMTHFYFIFMFAFYAHRIEARRRAERRDSLPHSSSAFSKERDLHAHDELLVLGKINLQRPRPQKQRCSSIKSGSIAGWG